MGTGRTWGWRAPGPGDPGQLGSGLCQPRLLGVEAAQRPCVKCFHLSSMLDPSYGQFMQHGGRGHADQGYQTLPTRPDGTHLLPEHDEDDEGDDPENHQGQDDRDHHYLKVRAGDRGQSRP